MHLFYEPEIKNNGNILNEEESFHCIKVLRHKTGDIIYIIDGNGRRFECKIAEPSQKQCKVVILREEVSSFRIPKCHIAIAPTKSIDRFEWFVEKSTEIGINEITPVLCMHSERKVLKPERIEKIITAAAKQSLSLWRPKLNPLISFSEFVSKNHFETQKFIAHCAEGDKKDLKKSYLINNYVIVLIGPEGDFDQVEINKAFSCGFKPVSLGNNRLRTETAAFAACHTIQLINE